ncbi:dephospho-CoA kinase [Parvularcula oceani]|uniref:dephospho-CoA kinase n=1 Tax=Parvularcula oceani TaxID=1247963 RepID=UPI0004E0D932|nr:dephospho-CoA kinase [Parvularcula oceani]
MITIGLTGSIGMGKSTTLRLFAEEGCAVWDADAAVHRLYAPKGEGAAAIAGAFAGVLTPEGGVDRDALGRHVLSDPAALARLEALIHPLVQEDRESFLVRARREGFAIAVCDIPLLFETEADDAFDVVVVVTAEEGVRRRRVLDRQGMTEAKLEAILARQTPEAERAGRADYVIRTDEGLPAARRAVRAILAALEENSSSAGRRGAPQ